MVAAFLAILLPLWWISVGPLLGLTLAQLVIYLALVVALAVHIAIVVHIRRRIAAIDASLL